MVTTLWKPCASLPLRLHPRIRVSASVVLVVLASVIVMLLSLKSLFWKFTVKMPGVLMMFSPPGEYSMSP